MSELRKDPVVGRWVIICPNRAERPNAFIRPAPRERSGPCPFCAGHEGQTPAEVFAFRGPDAQPDGPGWRVRVVPNQFPALDGRGGVGRWREGLYQLIEGTGAHEVIIESSRHVMSTSDLSVEELAEVFSAYRQRLRHWKQDPRLRYGLVFKNVGPEAGASMEHTHSQLIVTPLVPVQVLEEISGALEFYHQHGRCVYCQIVSQERESGRRLVLETPRFVAVSAFAARFPFETWVLPKEHGSCYEDMPEAELHELAAIFRRLIVEIEAVAPRVAYNYILHTAPFDTAAALHYHWHIEVIPSLTRAAGFEMGSGFFVNPVPPEEATLRLRQVDREKGTGTFCAKHPKGR